MSDTVNTVDLFDFDADFEAAFKDAEVRDNSPQKVEVPDGKYQCKVEKAYLDVYNGVKQFKMWLKILGGQYKDKVLFKNNPLKDKIGASILKSDLATMGHSLSNLSELKEILPQLLDLKVGVQKKTNQANTKYYNVYINDLIEEVTVGTNSADDVPF